MDATVFSQSFINNVYLVPLSVTEYLLTYPSRNASGCSQLWKLMFVLYFKCRDARVWLILYEANCTSSVLLKSHVQAQCAFVQVPPRNCTGISISPSCFNFDCSWTNKTEIRYRYRRSVGSPFVPSKTIDSNRSYTQTVLLWLGINCTNCLLACVTWLYHWRLSKSIANWDKRRYISIYLSIYLTTIVIIIIIIWFGDIVTVSHLTECNTNSKMRHVSAWQTIHPFPTGGFSPNTASSTCPKAPTWP